MPLEWQDNVVSGVMLLVTQVNFLVVKVGILILAIVNGYFILTLVNKHFSSE